MFATAEYKTVTFDDIVSEIRLGREAWNRVDAAPREERAAAIRREIHWPEGFLEQLKGRPLQEQMQYYRIVEEEYYSKTAYGEVTKSNQADFGYALEDYPGLRRLIVEDGVLIGVMIKSFSDMHSWGSPMFPYQTLCTYYASDNNGAGSSDREDYAHLCCIVPEPRA